MIYVPASRIQVNLEDEDGHDWVHSTRAPLTYSVGASTINIRLGAKLTIIPLVGVVSIEVTE